MGILIMIFLVGFFTIVIPLIILAILWYICKFLKEKTGSCFFDFFFIIIIIILIWGLWTYFSTENTLPIVLYFLCLIAPLFIVSAISRYFSKFLDKKTGNHLYKYFIVLILIIVVLLNNSTTCEQTNEIIGCMDFRFLINAYLGIALVITLIRDLITDIRYLIGRSKNNDINNNFSNQ